MENTTLPQLQGLRIRVANLNPVGGRTIPGANNVYTTDAFVKVGFAPVYKDGTEIEEENAQGVVCAQVKGKPTYKRGDISIEICTPDPYLGVLLGGGRLIDLGDGRIGAAAAALGEVADRAVSIEVWAKRIDNGDLDADSPYAWWAYPKVINLRPAEHEHSNTALKPSYTGEAYENAGWADGPLNDWPAASDRVHQWIPWDSLPEVTYNQTVAAS